MSEHTPSPQSVVVPLEDWQHVIGALKNAKARLPMGAAIGNVSDALSKVEHLQAAPAPSSLAGGEVRDAAKRLGSDLDEGRILDFAVSRDISIVLAALSPEAPARVGVVMAATDVPMWADGIVTDGENVAMAQKAEADHGGHYWAVDGGNGGLDWEPTHFISLDALTPRHEAPAEGAGDGMDAYTRPDTIEAIRARSSAPEAREGEAWCRAVADLRAYQPEDEELSIIKQKVVAVFETTHPAAPSADKLREVLIDLTSWFTKPVQGQNGMVWVIRAGEMGADDALNAALAALKAEG